MFIVIEITDQLNSEEVQTIKNEISDFVSHKGYNCEVYDYLSEAFIKSEIQHRNNNIDEFELERNLSNQEILDLTKKIFSLDEIFSDLTYIIDDEIRLLFKRGENDAK